MCPLVRLESPGDDIDALQARATERESTLAERDREIGRAKADLTAFGHRYRQAVGKLHDELDELERAIREAEASERPIGPDDAGSDATASTDSPRPEPAARYTSDVVRRLFRDVAKAIHPDLAADDHTRDRRHTLMIEANKAYARGDEERLRSILHAWKNAPEMVIGDDLDAARQRLVRRIAIVEEQIAAAESELAELKESPLWKLKAMVDEAAAGGRNLVTSMIGQLKRDIMVARNRLDVIR